MIYMALRDSWHIYSAVTSVPEIVRVAEFFDVRYPSDDVIDPMCPILQHTASSVKFLTRVVQFSEL